MLKRYILPTLLFTSLLNADNIYNTFPTDKEALAFKKGVQFVVMSLKDGREFKIQGTNEEEFIPKNFIVFIDSTELDDPDKMAIQKLGFIYSESVRLTNNTILISSFENKPNATTLAKTLNRDYFYKNAPHRQAQVREVQSNEKFYKEKSLFSEIANIVKNNLENEIKVISITNNEQKPREMFVPTIKDTTYENFETTQIETQKHHQIVKEPKKAKKTYNTSKDSYSNKEPFSVLFLPTGKYITKYKLLKNIDSNNISLISDFEKQSQTESIGDIIASDRYVVTTEKIKLLKGEDGFFYKESESKIISDFVNGKE